MVLEQILFCPHQLCIGAPDTGRDSGERMATVAVSILSAVVVCVVFYLWPPLIILAQGEAVVIERLGKRHRVLTRKGPHVVWPLIERRHYVKWSYLEEVDVHDDEEVGDGNEVNDGVPAYRKAHFKDCRIPTREQCYEMPMAEYVTKDQSRLQLRVTVQYKISDVEKAVYETANLYEEMQSELEQLLETLFSGVESSQVELEWLRQRLLGLFKPHKKFVDWGLAIRGVRIKKIVWPDDAVNGVRAVLESKKVALATRSRREVEVENDILVERRERDLELERLAHQSKVQDLKQELERKHAAHTNALDRERYRVAAESGLPPEYHTAELYAAAWRRISSSPTSVLFPSNQFHALEPHVHK